MDRPSSSPGDSHFDALVDDDPRELYERAPCAYLSTSLDGRIIKANGTFFAWCGYRPTEIIGARRLQELLAPGDRILYETHLAPLLQMQGQMREIALDLVLANGERLPVIANSVVAHDEAGSPLLIRTVLFDARERRSYERELLRARRRAEESEAREHRLAQTLQASFLPPTQLMVPGIDVAGAYRPAGDGSEVGGDFYDVFETGRQSHAVILGDVAGKGVDAAVVTALVRYTARAAALNSSSPAQALRNVHGTMRQLHPDRFCTAVMLELRRTHEAFEAVIAVGGHPLPIKSDGRRTQPVGRSGLVVGMVDEPRVHDQRVPLHHGEALVLYTDGVVEARNGTGFFGTERLSAIIEQTAHHDAATIAGTIVDAVVEYSGGTPRDDIAVVVISIPPARRRALVRSYWWK